MATDKLSDKAERILIEEMHRMGVDSIKINHLRQLNDILYPWRKFYSRRSLTSYVWQLGMPGRTGACNHLLFSQSYGELSRFSNFKALNRILIRYAVSLRRRLFISL